MPSQVWFITGASSGFGLAMVEHVLAKGDVAIAVVRNPAKISIADLAAKHPPSSSSSSSASRLLVVKADVSKPEDVSAAFAAAQKEFGRIDVVFNNAAIGFFAEVEGSSEPSGRDNINLNGRSREVFDVNFWGAMHVSNEAVRFFRDVNRPCGGRLVINSSSARFSCTPLMGVYTATKYALEGITEVMVAELKPEWAIKATIIEPGPFKTPGAENLEALPIPAAYAGGVTAHMRAAIASGKAFEPDDVAKGVRAIYDAANDPAAPARIPLGVTAIANARKHVAMLGAQLDEGVEKWSKDLKFD